MSEIKMETGVLQMDGTCIFELAHTGGYHRGEKELANAFSLNVQTNHLMKHLSAETLTKDLFFKLKTFDIIHEALQSVVDGNKDPVALGKETFERLEELKAVLWPEGR